MNIQESFGKIVRSIREAKGMSIDDLADAAGLHYTYVSDVERGRRNITLKTIHALASGLKVHPSRLLTTGDDKFVEGMAILGSLNQKNLDMATEILKILVRQEPRSG
jgi:transcriptional regulator with XRE-family HTH domain